MSQPDTTLPPVCKRCGRFLHTADELRFGYCSRCPVPLSELPPEEDDAPFCCQSDPPCAACPFGG